MTEDALSIRSGPNRSASIRWLVVAAMLAWVWLTSLATGQTTQPASGPPLPPALPPGSELPALGDSSLSDRAAPADLMPIPVAPPRPAEPKPFIESLKGTDATFEVLVGQSRILTLREDITAGAQQPLISVGDPKVIEFNVLNPRQIRITGQRIGATDLSIMTAKGQNYSYEVRVTYNLSLLESKLRSLFPDTSIRLGQVGNQVVVEGEARSNAQISQIQQTIASHLASLPTSGAAQGGGVGRGGGMASGSPRGSGSSQGGGEYGSVGPARRAGQAECGPGGTRSTGRGRPLPAWSGPTEWARPGAAHCGGGAGAARRGGRCRDLSATGLHHVGGVRATLADRGPALHARDRQPAPRAHLAAGHAQGPRGRTQPHRAAEHRRKLPGRRFQHRGHHRDANW